MLLDRWLPEFDVSKRHALSIPASCGRVYRELIRHDFGGSVVTVGLMCLRGYRVRRGGRSSLQGRLERLGFTLLEEAPGEELVFGIAGKFWQLDGGLTRVSAGEFAPFSEPGFAKAAWNLRVAPGTEGSVCELSTETRVQCFGKGARRRFLRYWSVVEPFSGAIRTSLLRAVRKSSLSRERAERGAG